MKLYTITYKEGYESFYLKEEDDEIMEKYEGIQSIQEEWGVRKIDLEDKERESDLAYFWTSSSSLLISEKAKTLLKEFLNPEEVELLPVSYKERKFYLVHGIKSYDVDCKYVELPKEWCCLDKTEYNKKQLMEKGLDKKGMFRIEYTKGEVSSFVFTEKFIDAIKKYDLKGIDFELEWDSEKNWENMSEREVKEMERGIFYKESDEIETDFGENLQLDLEVQEINMKSENELVEAVSDVSKMFGNKVIEHYGRKVNRIIIYYFYDGECIDLFMNISLYNEETDIVAQPEYSFTFQSKKLGKNILDYIHSIPRIEQGEQLEKLAERVAQNLQKDKSWLKELNPTEEIEIEMRESD